MLRLALAAALGLAAALPAAAESPRLAFPLDCTLGETCFIEDYVDHDPAPGKAHDFACGLNTRDGHKGTDIALLSFDAIATGITVRAAAPGRVLRTRDGMADDRLMRGVTAENACGNAVILDHGDGWNSRYCHLRRGSITVNPGDRVAAGDALGLVGLSGRTNHPHLHLGLYHDGAVVDPFRPEGGEDCGAAEPPTLWRDPPAYHKTLLRRAGFSDHLPDYDGLRGGKARRDRLAPDQPLIVYAEAGHAEHGDEITIFATGPSGAETFRHTRILENPRVSYLPAFGRKPPPGGWPEGDYTGEILLTRHGKLIAHRFAHVTVAAP